MEQAPNPMNSNTSLKKKWLLPVVIGVILLLIGGGIAAFFILRSTPAKEQLTEAPKQAKNFTMTTKDTAIKYAGNPVYDACGIISFDTLRSTVNNYQTLLDMNDTDQKPSEPLTIEHRYVDRDIASPLGKDDQPRPTGITIGSGVTDANSFISTSDTNCWYGQGNGLSIGSGSIFAKVYITQKPTPLSSDLLAYLATLTKIESQGDVVGYVEPQADNGGFYTGIVINEKKGVVAFIKTATKELASKATTEAFGKLLTDAKGPMNLIYPSGWSKMPNPCLLLTANDFQQATGKPASALAEDTLGLNEIGGKLMQRSCERLEVERLDGSPIAKSNVTVRMGKDENAAKEYVNFLKNNQEDTFEIQPLKQKIALGDEAYIKVIKNGNAINGYEFDMRIGQAVIVLAIDTDAGLDSSADTFASRMIPIALEVADRYK